MRLEVGLALGKSLSEVDELDPDEVALHFAHLTIRAQEEAEAVRGGDSGAGQTRTVHFDNRGWVERRRTRERQG